MRPKGTDTETELRQWLLADRVEFRKQMCVTLAVDPAWSAQAWEQLSHSVDALAGGEPCRRHGYQLPLGHWALMHGVNADWILGGDDVLRPT